MKNRIVALLGVLVLSTVISRPSTLLAADDFITIQGGQATQSGTGVAARLETTSTGTGASKTHKLKTDGGAGGGSGGGGPATIADGADVAQGSKADAKSTATDTTPISLISILKQISASVQAPPSQAVTGPLTDTQLRATAVPVSGTVNVTDGAGALNVIVDSGTTAATQSGTWTVQPGNTANTTAWKVDGSAVTQPASIADGSAVTVGSKADAKSTATDTTSVSLVSILKQISASVQAPPSQAVTGPLTDSQLRATAVPVSGTVTANPTAAATVKSTAFEASHVLKASAGSLASITVYNSNASAQFILIMDSATVPANGAVTLLLPPIPIAGATVLQIQFEYPLVASTGISISNSSTGTFTKTIGSADCAFTAQVF